MIKFTLCAERALLDDYYALRQRCYRMELGLAGFDGAQEREDVEGELLIAHHGGRCVGGARISGGTAVARQLPDVALPAGSSCTWERLVLRPECRSLDLARQFCERLVTHSWELGYEQAVIFSSLRNARFYRMCHAAMGVDFEIIRPLPEHTCRAFKGLENYLSIAHLRPAGAALQRAA